MNGYPDDAYGWNFFDGADGSPNIIRNGPPGGHGASAMGAVLHALTAAGSHGDRVRIMVVIGSRSQTAQYVLAEKAQGVNIVAVAHSSPGGFFGRAEAEAFRNADILLFVASSNAGSNIDNAPVGPTSNALYHATPRFGIQEAPVHTVIPATTDPGIAQTDHGINSFYFAAPSVAEQSFTPMVAAAYAAIAVEAYQEFPGHNGQNPTPEQIKRAMMSGVQYIAGLDDKTITHDYVGGERRDGGLLSRDAMITAINQTTPEITNVSITQGAVVDPLGTTVNFSLNRLGETPSNWTISWGDNSFDDRSGVQVRPGTQQSIQHTFPFDNLPHHYFPTIYAMSGTKQVYLPAPSAQVEVVITTPFVPTSGQDHYTLTRSGANTVLTLQNSSGTVSHSFAPGELPRCFMTLGPGADTLTVDFSNGNPLESTALSVSSAEEAGAVVRVIATAGADSISVTNGTLVTVNGTQFPISIYAGVYVDAGAGDDQVSVFSPASTLIGGAGNDLLELPFGAQFPFVIDGGDGIDTLRGVSGPDANISNVEYFVTTDGSDNVHVNRYNFDGLRLFNVVQQPGGHTVFAVKEALLALEVDAFGAWIYGYGPGELVPIGTVTSLVVNGEDKDDDFYIDANVNATVNAAGGNDHITVIAPNATINGGAGNDTIIGGANNNSIVGGDGDDVIDAGDGNDTIDGGAGNDHIDGGGGNDSINGNDGMDTIYGGSGDDTITGGKGEDVLHGDDGDDLIFSVDGGDIDTIFGGNGFDTAWVDEDDIVDSIEDLIIYGFTG